MANYNLPDVILGGDTVTNTPLDPPPLAEQRFWRFCGFAELQVFFLDGFNRGWRRKPLFRKSLR